MKQDSEIGVALAAGHPCYFIGFLPEPDARPDDRGRLPRRGGVRRGGRARAIPRPRASRCVIANCQAGWQIMMMAAIRPDLCGPIMLAGSPLSYWAGVRGKNPMRYLGGTARRHLADRARRRPRRRHLRRRQSGRQLRVAQPGQHLLGEALQRLFQGRHRGRALPRLRDLVGQPGAAQCRRDAVDRRQPVRRQQADHGRDPHLRRACAIDLRNITLADHRVLLVGRQHHAAAAGAGLDHRPLRRRATRSSPTARPSSTRCTRRSAISASSSPARWRRKEHDEFASCMEMIDLLPPGLYEAVITEVDEDTDASATSSTASTCSGWRRARWTTSARSAATAPRTTSASPPPRASPRSTTASTARSPQPVVRAMTTEQIGRGDAADASQPPALRACSPTRTR